MKAKQAPQPKLKPIDPTQCVHFEQPSDALRCCWRNGRTYADLCDCTPAFFKESYCRHFTPRGGNQ